MAMEIKKIECHTCRSNFEEGMNVLEVNLVYDCDTACDCEAGLGLQIERSLCARSR